MAICGLLPVVWKEEGCGLPPIDWGKEGWGAGNDGGLSMEEGQRESQGRGKEKSVPLFIMTSPKLVTLTLFRIHIHEWNE